MEAQLVWMAQAIVATARASSWVEVALKFFPFVLLLELPLFMLVVLGLVRYGVLEHRPNRQREHYPSVSCIVTCYAEGEAVRKTIETLVWQEYPGHIQIIPVVDGALANEGTYTAARAVAAELGRLPRREVMVVPKWQRGGRVSGLNTGLDFATGEIVMALDGDTSFDNDMVLQATRHFDDPNVAGVGGCLRVRNAGVSVATRLQALEYMLAISGSRTAMSQFNLVNNISGAFGVFRSAFIRHLGGWDAGTAEDLDLTLRIKQYFGRHPELRIVFDPHAVGHTDVPDSFGGFFHQRMRWEGDLFYVFIRKYRHNLRPRLMGWSNFFSIVVTGLLLQLLMPFAIVAYTGVMLVALPWAVVAGLAAIIYLAYLLAMLFLFGLYLVTVSERPRHDLRFLPWLPLMPLFGLAARMHSAYAILGEVLLKSHLDSAMAPWWVLRKTKF